MKTCKQFIGFNGTIVINCNAPASFWYMSPLLKTVITRCGKHELDLDIHSGLKPISFEETIAISVILE